MTRTEAIEALLQGKCVRHTSWEHGSFLRLYGQTVLDERGKKCGFSEFDKYKWHDWEVYEG